MRVLKVCSLKEAEEWDKIVRSFIEYDVYWLSGYVKAFQIHGDGEPLLIYYEKNNTRGINVVMKRDVALDMHFKGRIESGKFFDFSTPYGYGGWIIEGRDVEDLFHAYEHWINENNIICEFVRFHPLIKNHKYCEQFYNIIQLGEVVHMDLHSPDDIWNNIVSKNRNVIRKAKKNNIKIYNGRFPEIYKKFQEIYDSTMDKNNAAEYYYFEPEFYMSILEDLPQNAQVFWAEKEEQIIAASIILTTNGLMNYHLSGSLREFSSLAPSNLLLYTAAIWGSLNGYQTFYLGGGVGSGEDNLFKFKKAFYKGKLNHFFIGKKIYNSECYDDLVNMRKNTESGFFPKYRA